MPALSFASGQEAAFATGCCRAHRRQCRGDDSDRRSHLQPQSAGRELDTARSRSKRLFNDRTGIRCGSHQQPLLLQTYTRDTGELMHDLSVPIFINGRHWGGLRNLASISRSYHVQAWVADIDPVARQVRLADGSLYRHGSLEQTGSKATPP